MPCDTVQTTSVDLSLKAGNRQHLVDALRSLYGANRVMLVGDTISFTTKEGLTGVWRNGQLTVTSRDRYGRTAAAEQFDVNPIKRAMSHEVVKAAKVKFGWNLETDPQNKFKFKVRKKGM